MQSIETGGGKPPTPPNVPNMGTLYSICIRQYLSVKSMDTRGGSDFKGGNTKKKVVGSMRSQVESININDTPGGGIDTPPAPVVNREEI
jgi:hypothetical protein